MTGQSGKTFHRELKCVPIDQALEQKPASLDELLKFITGEWL